MKSAEEIASEVDVMSGMGHISGFTEEGRARRRAADYIRAQAAEIGRLREELAYAAECVTVQTYDDKRMSKYRHRNLRSIVDRMLAVSGGRHPIDKPGVRGSLGRASTHVTQLRESEYAAP